MSRIFHTSSYRALMVFALPLSAAAADQNAALPPSPWSPTASLAVKEGYDNNVYLESVGPHANKDSFTSLIVPIVGIGYKASDAFNASLSYSPEMNFFYSASSEDFTTHRTALTLAGKPASSTKWDLNNSFIAVQGADTGAIYPTTGGGATAGGGPQAMLRRNLFLERGQARVTQNFGDWFVRPTVSGFLYDFRIKKETTPGYQNLVDRNEFAAGADAGYALFKNTSLVAGYRYGFQNQAKLFANPIHYDNTFHRILFGVEGSPCKWAQINISFGPEFRTYDGVLTAGTDPHQNFIYSDSTLTLSPTKNDSVALSAKRFQQPGFSGRSAYTDSTYDGSWKHKFGSKLTVGIGAKAYNLDFVSPIKRNDWIYTGYGVVSYAFTKQWSAEASYSYDSAESRYPDDPAREYTRSQVALGAKYTFK